MVSGLLDTSILVDVARGYAPAQIWINQQDNLGVTRIVWLELLQGAPNKQAEALSLRLLKRFVIQTTSESDLEWAVEAVLKTHLSHNVGALDALIAAPSHRLQIPLYTRNLKHFTPILGHLAQQPY